MMQLSVRSPVTTGPSIAKGHSTCSRPMRRQRAVAVRAQAEPSPVVKGMSDGMGLLKPLFAAEAKVQGAALGQLSGYTLEDAVAEIEEAKNANKASPVSSCHVEFIMIEGRILLISTIHCQKNVHLRLSAADAPLPAGCFGAN